MLDKILCVQLEVVSLPEDPEDMLVYIGVSFTTTPRGTGGAAALASPIERRRRLFERMTPESDALGLILVMMERISGSVDYM